MAGMISSLAVRGSNALVLAQFDFPFFGGLSLSGYLPPSLQTTRFPYISID